MYLVGGNAALTGRAITAQSAWSKQHTSRPASRRLLASEQVCQRTVLLGQPRAQLSEPLQWNLMRSPDCRTVGRLNPPCHALRAKSDDATRPWRLANVQGLTAVSGPMSSAPALSPWMPFATRNEPRKPLSRFTYSHASMIRPIARCFATMHSRMQTIHVLLKVHVYMDALLLRCAALQ